MSFTKIIKANPFVTRAETIFMDKPLNINTESQDLLILPYYYPRQSTLLTDLISYWKLDEESGTRYDSHGSNHLTDNNGVSQVTGKQGTAAKFIAASNQYLTCSSNPSLQVGDSPFTVACWIYIDSKSSHRIIVAKPGNIVANEEDEFWLYYSNTDSLSFYIADGDTSYPQINFGSLSTGNYYFIVAWYDPSNNKICLEVNGVVQEHSTVGGNQSTNGDFHVGGWVANAAYAWDGRIDEVGFWKRVLTEDERAQLYNSGEGTTYPF